MPTAQSGQQLTLKLLSVAHDHVFEAPELQPQQRRNDGRKLPAELNDTELLTTVLGPSTALSCTWLTTTYDNFREIASATTAELVEHGFTTGAVNRRVLPVSVYSSIFPGRSVATEATETERRICGVGAG